MKKLLLALFCVTVTVYNANSTVHIVQVANFQFTPEIINNVFVGDTIRWVWVSGGHTTTCDQNQDPSTFLPAGAPTWSSSINSSNPTFEYKVTVAGTYHYVFLPHTPDMAGTFTASVVTPVKLTSFDLEASKDIVSLKWKVQNEENVDHYIVRKSYSGVEYFNLGNVEANGAAASYNFDDTELSTKNKYSYYNLAIINKDGSKTYSPVKMYRNDKAVTKLILTLGPNPLRSPGHLNLTFNSDVEGIMDVKLIDNQGKTIMVKKMQAYPGANKGHLHIGELSSGVYTISFVLNGIKEMHTIIFK